MHVAPIKVIFDVTWIKNEKLHMNQKLELIWLNSSVGNKSDKVITNHSNTVRGHSSLTCYDFHLSKFACSCLALVNSWSMDKYYCHVCEGREHLNDVY